MSDGTSDRLDSWKDIASYLKRDVSTVQRWERREGLPVHRHRHDKLGSVYAFRDEIDVWRLARVGASRPGSAPEAGQPVEAINENRRARRAFLIAAAAGVAAIVLVSAWVGTRPRGVTSPSPSSSIESLVVLPLANLSGDPAQDHLAEGLTEELTSALAQLKSLRVVSRTTATRFRARQTTVPDLARELDVDAILEGSVRHETGRVRISLQLVDAATDSHLWARDFERDAGSVLALQAEVAQAVATELRVQLSAEETTRLASARAVNPAAHREYLVGRHLLWKFIEHDRVRAIEHFRRAIALAPDYAEPYAGLAHAWWSRGVLGPLTMADVAPHARAAAEKALALDDRLPEAYAAKAYVQGVFDWDWTGAEATIQHGLAVGRNSVEVHYIYALLLMALGRLDESVREIEAAARIDPLSAQVQSTFGRILYRARRYDEAAARLLHAIELEPRHAVSYSRLGDVYEATRRYDDALKAFGQQTILLGRPNAVDVSIARVYARMGRTDRATELRSEPSPALWIALGNHDRAFTRLFESVKRRDDWPIFIKRDPMYDSLHDDPRWPELLRRMNLPIG